MAKYKIELISSGVRELLKSEAVENMCHERANQIASRAGAGYATDTYKGRNRVNASVWADTPEARRDNLKNNTLLRAMR